MNMANNGIKYGVSQYRFPLSYQFRGQKINLTDSVGTKYVLNFIDKENITFTNGNSAPELSTYECLKADDETYFVSFGLILRIAVIDLANGTAVLMGEKETDNIFCKITDFPYGAKSIPGYTDEMTGTAVRWVLGCNRYVNQIYCSGSACRCAWSPRDDKYRDAPTTFIKIKNGVYLCDVWANPPIGVDMPQGFGRLIMLQDFEHMMLVGCAFAPYFKERFLISAYGSFSGIPQDQPNV